MVLYHLIKKREEQQRLHAEQEAKQRREQKANQLRSEWTKGFTEGFAQGRATVYAEWAEWHDRLLNSHPELKDTLVPLAAPAEIGRPK